MIREMIIRHEGVKLKPYFDTVGVLTIGVGWNLKAHPLPADIASYFHIHRSITYDMAMELLDMSLDAAIRQCREVFPDFLTYTEKRQAAIIDMTFQMGAGIWNGMTARFIREGKWKEAAERIKTWKYYKQTPGRAEENIGLLQ